jgi:hypothetical protein
VPRTQNACHLFRTSVHSLQTPTGLKDKTLAIFCTSVHSLQILTVLIKCFLPIITWLWDNTLAIFLCARAYLLQMLTLVNDKTLATFEPVSILFKLSPCWKTKRSAFFNQCLFLQTLTLLKDETPAIFHQCSFFNFSPFWKTQYLPFFSSVYFLRTLIFLNGNTLAVFPVSIFFKFSPSWKTRRLPFVVPAFFFFNYSPCWKTKRLPPFCTSVNSLQIFIVLEQIKTRHF